MGETTLFSEIEKLLSIASLVIEIVVILHTQKVFQNRID